MSIPNLPVDFKDDILASSNTKRKYRQTANDDSTVSFEDVTNYSQEGSEFGAKEVNQTNTAINNIYDERILDLDELELVTEPGFFVDAQAAKEAYDTLNSKRTIIYDQKVSGTPIEYTLDRTANGFDALEIHCVNNNGFGIVQTVYPSEANDQYPRSFIVQILPPAGEGGETPNIWVQSSRFQLSSDGMQLSSVRSVQVRIGQSGTSANSTVSLFVEKIIGIML